MADSIIDLVYYAIISALSTWLYYDRLSRKKGSLIRRRMIVAAMLIFVSHLVMFIPAYDGIKTLFYVGQIISEFYIVVWMFDEKTVNKLIAYIEVNVAIGIGMTGGYAILNATIEGQDIFGQAEIFEKALFYIVTLTVTGVICFMLSYVDRRKDKTDNMKGVEASVVICMALLCILYAVGMTMVELKDSWKLWVVYGYFVVMTIMVLILLYINKRVQQNEDINIKYQVLKNVHENMAELEQELKAEEEYYRDKKEWLENTLFEIYDDMNMSTKKVLETLVAKKVSNASKRGVDIQYKLDVTTVDKLHVYDVVSIYSNLLDNAIRATSESIHKAKLVKMEGEISDEKFYLMIENPYESVVVEKDGEYVTTKQDEDRDEKQYNSQHGLGIKNIKAIAEKYNMTVEIDTDNDIFRVVVQGK